MTWRSKSTFVGITLMAVLLLLSSLFIALAAAQTPSPSPTPPPEKTPTPPPEETPTLPPEETLNLAISVDDATFDERTGLAEVTVTVTCSEPAHLFFVDTSVTQPVTRLESVRGFDSIGFFPYGDELMMCDGQETVTFMVVPENGMFAEGHAFIRASTYGCTEIPMMPELDAWIAPEDNGAQQPGPGPDPENCDSARTLKIPDLRAAGQ